MSEEEILIALKEIHARYCIPASEQNYTDKDYACMQYEKLIIHLQKEIDRLNNIINELEKWLNEYYKSNRKWYNAELSNHDKQYYEEIYRNTEFMIVKFLKQLKELKEDK